jgi:hypothetical protein
MTRSRRGHRHLHRSEADAGCFVHGFEHVLDQAADFVRDRFDGRGLLAQQGIGDFDDREERHGGALG